MRLLFAYGSEPHYMSPPRLAEEQIDCGPYFHDRRHDGRWLSVATPRGDYDLAKVAERLGPDQQPDLVAVHVDGASMAGTPRNLGAFKCPKLLLVADTHHGANPLGNLIRYALDQPFDRVVLLYDRHHADFFRAAGIKNLHWLPSLTFAHSDARVRAASGADRESRIAIVGTTGYHPRRLRLFSALVGRGLPLDWREIHQSEAISHYAGSLVGLNASMNGDLNMRVFEILAGGALLLTDRLAPASGLDLLLREDRDYVGYSNAEELIEKAAHLLAHPAEASAIAASGARWFRENYSEAHRRRAFAELAFDGRERPEFVLPDSSPRPPPPLGLDAAIGGYHWLQLHHQKHESLRVVCADGVPDFFPAIFSTLPRLRLISPADTAAAPADLWVGGLHQAPPPGRATHTWLWNATPAALPALAARFAPLKWKHLVPEVALFGAAPVEAGSPAAAKARTHLQNGDLVGALRHAGAALQADPRCVDAVLVVTELALEAQNWDAAASHLAQAAELAPAHPLVPLLRRQLALRPPPRQPRRLLAVARLAYDWRDHVRARTFAELALAADADCADAEHLLGLLDFYHSGQADSPAERLAGLARLRRATELQPARADYWLELGHACRLLNRPAEAALAFRAVLAREPSASACLALGEALLAAGSPNEAARILRAGLAFAPAHAALRESLRRAETPPPVAATRPVSQADPDRPAFPPAVARLLRESAHPPEQVATRIAAAFHDLALAGAPRPSSARRVLLAHQPWFDIPTPSLLLAAHEHGLDISLIDESTTPAAGPREPITRANLRDIAHRGVRLWDVCRYRLALELRRPALDLDPDNPSDRAALEAFYAHAVSLLDKAALHLAHYQPDTVVFAQGHDTLSAVLRHLAVLRGLRVLALENTFRKDRLLWDDLSGVTVNQNLARNHYWRHRAHLDDATASATVAAYLTRLPALKSAEHAAPHDAATAPSSSDATPTRTLLYLAQVGTDSSVLFGLRRFGTQARLIAELAAYAAARIDLRLVIKLHPKENPSFQDDHPWVRGLTAGALDACPEFVAARERLGPRLLLDTDNRHDTYALIRAADVCVTINSQAGLEALVLGREVVLCGDAFYGGLGFTHEADDAPALRFRLARIIDEGLRLNHGPDARAFFHIHSELYCRPKTLGAVLDLLDAPTISPAATTPADRPDRAASGAATLALLAPDRIDLAAKYLFFRALDGRGDLAGAETLYRRHIAARTGGHEPPDATTGAASAKRSVDDYVAAARELHASMRAHGFAPAHPVPVTAEGRIGNGAHRLACALALGLDVPTWPCVSTGPGWDAAWFSAHGFTDADLRRLLHTWAGLRPADSALFLLWSPLESAWPEMERQIARNFAVVGASTLDFAENPAAFRELVFDIYSPEAELVHMPHIERKLDTLSAHPARLRVVLAANLSRAERTGDLATRTKHHLRRACAHLAPAEDFVTCHANATTAELLHLRAVLLDENNLTQLLARPPRAPRTAFLRWLDTLKAALAAQGIPLADCCVVGSSSLEVLGLRESTDLDITLLRHHRHPRFGGGITRLAEQVDIVTEGYHRVHAPRVPITDDELIDDPRHHFVYRGVKFAMPTIILDRKDYSRRPKDVADVERILAHLAATRSPASTVTR
jgi:tetratricopeptide (TPR) repeat protein